MKILLKDIRDKRHLTLDRLAKLSGISRATLQRIEVGRVSPTMDNMEILAQTLGITISDLYESEYK